MSPARTISTILFDLDGTLIDSVELILRSYRHTLLACRGQSPPDDVWLAGLGTPLWDQFRSFTEDEAEIDAMVETYRAFNLEHHDRLVRPYPGVPEAVRQLKRRGHALAIVTSKMTDTAWRGLELCGYADCFSIVVGADSVVRHKPDPEPVHQALQLLSRAAGEAVFVGDSPHDIAAGRAAGVMTAAVLWGPFERETLAHQKPDLWMREPHELARIGEQDHDDGPHSDVY